jgi:cell division protein FtsL
MIRRSAKKKMAPRALNRKPRGQSNQAFWSVLAVAVFILFVLYLGGKVHIEYVLRETEALGESKAVLEKKAADLRIQVNALQGYDRIVRKAQEQGLVFVRHNDIAELQVDLKGIEHFQNNSKSKLQLARIVPF